MNIGADIVYHSDLYFDPTDPNNGSLYLCMPPGTPNSDIEPLIDLLRDAALWSSEPYKSVPETHKKNYAAQMQFLACSQFTTGSITFVVARYNHAKFPSNAERWLAWLTLLNAKFG